MAKVADPKKNISKKDSSSSIEARDRIEFEAIDAYFERKADAAKKTLDRIGFPEQLVPKK